MRFVLYFLGSVAVAVVCGAIVMRVTNQPSHAYATVGLIGLVTGLYAHRFIARQD